MHTSVRHEWHVVIHYSFIVNQKTEKNTRNLELLLKLYILKRKNKKTFIQVEFHNIALSLRLYCAQVK